MLDTASANLSALISRERTANAIRDALRLYVGRGRRYSVKQLSNGTGVKDRVIECAMCAHGTEDWRMLPTEALLSIALFLGPDFTNEWIKLADQGAFLLPDDEPNPGLLAADNAEDGAVIARAAADADFENDRGVLPAVGARMVSRGAQLVALGRKAA